MIFSEGRLQTPSKFVTRKHSTIYCEVYTASLVSRYFWGNPAPITALEGSFVRAISYDTEVLKGEARENVPSRLCGTPAAAPVPQSMHVGRVSAQYRTHQELGP